MIAAYVVAGAQDHRSCSNWRKYPFPHSFQMWAFPLVFIGFAILAGLWPFHTWAPTGHVAAPDGGLDAAGRRGDEAGRLRLLARGDDVVSRSGLKAWQQF